MFTMNIDSSLYFNFQISRTLIQNYVLLLLQHRILEKPAFDTSDAFSDFYFLTTRDFFIFI